MGNLRIKSGHITYKKANTTSFRRESDLPFLSGRRPSHHKWNFLYVFDTSRGLVDQNKMFPIQNGSHCDRTRTLFGSESDPYRILFEHADPRRADPSHVKDVCATAGEQVLKNELGERMAEAIRRHRFKTSRRSLPMNVVAHTGVAISHTMVHLDAVYRPDVRIHCVHAETALRTWPERGRPAHVQMLDNVKHCLRNFGVDGRSTRDMRRSLGSLSRPPEFMLRYLLRAFANFDGRRTPHLPNGGCVVPSSN